MKMLSLNIQKKCKFNYVLFFLMIMLSLIGCIFVYSASYYSANITYGKKDFFLQKQVIGVVIGLICYVFFSFFDYHFFKKIKWWLFGISVILLALVFVPGVGLTNYGATRWINLRFITFQPSEIAKFVFIVLSADILSKSDEKIKTFKGILPILLIGGVYCFLIIIEPNMSITICMAMLVVVMLFLGGAKIKHFIMLMFPAIMIVILLIVIEPYRLKRLIAFMDPFASKQDEGFQLVQSLLGIALGNMFGVGVFKSRQKYLFLPFSESDFIFSIIAEETGFIGALLLIIIFILLFVTIIKVAREAKDKFGFLLACGVGSVIIIQVMLNISV
ncbi:MAG: FtsW/RodA/SpoVE family cell cycle protein, partial [Clostridia bacterium]|nr:FtsW/RodA/SpoVE family cell cycle protein [Clostridia bacterium]